MAFDTKLANRTREYLAEFPNLKIEEKKMFRGLAFIVNEKMCINVSGENLMCRFDPKLQEKISEKKGYQAMVMKGKLTKGYCYINPEGIEAKEDFEYFVNLCVEFNKFAKASKR